MIRYLNVDVATLNFVLYTVGQGLPSAVLRLQVLVPSVALSKARLTVSIEFSRAKDSRLESQVELTGIKDGTVGKWSDKLQHILHTNEFITEC